MLIETKGPSKYYFVYIMKMRKCFNYVTFLCLFQEFFRMYKLVGLKLEDSVQFVI